MNIVASAVTVARADADRFFNAWRTRQAATSRALDDLAWLHRRLLDASFAGASGPPRRRLAISTPGVPVVYSHKCSRDDERPRFRMLAEPGGTDTTVAEQIRQSRALFELIVQQFEWRDAGDRVNAVLDRLLPADSRIVDEWHGGLGFGVEADDRGPELRVYCNVRHGDYASRWQRFADAIGEFADVSVAPAFGELLEVVGPRAAPAGVALAIGGNEVRGVRLYCGLIDATAESAVAAAPRTMAEWGAVVSTFVESYRAAFGNLDQESVTLAYDFVCRRGLLHPSVVRYKVDVWCERPSSLEPDRLVRWTGEQIDSLGLSSSGLRPFLADLDGAFGGSTLQYLSLGCRGDGAEFSVYCIPGRFTLPSQCGQ